MINEKAGEVIKKCFKLFLIRYHDYVNLLYYKYHKVNLNGGGSYIDSPDWIKNKKATINAINKKDNK